MKSACPFLLDYFHIDKNMRKRAYKRTATKLEEAEGFLFRLKAKAGFDIPANTFLLMAENYGMEY